MGGKTLVILARPNDPVAAIMVERWSSEDVRVITPPDLSAAGWSYRSSAPGASVAVAGGRALPASEIGGVITRLPCVFEADLSHMEPADRAYAATEMTAFLLAWLCGLECPVVNRPTPTALWGPSWRQEKWARIAHGLGIPVETVRRKVNCKKSDAAVPAASAVAVTVVGQRCLGKVDDDLSRQARLLADAARVDMLSVRFSSTRKGARFLGASVWPDVVTDEVVDALQEYLRG